MRLLLSWLRDFVQVDEPADAIAETLALRGFEVASIESVGNGDHVLDLEITANRPDCLSVLGLAREIGTAYRRPVRTSMPAAETPIGEVDRLSVVLEDAARCPRYSAAVADVSDSSSPSWMTSRLEAAGVRPISPIVDITNYVLMEIGHPMHAFDLDTLAGHELRIRPARTSETLTTLDGLERKLDDDMLVIADAVRPQAVAGVMGGAYSEVSARTRTIAFESAYFSPPSVRRTSKRLNLKTEASARFERGADINAPVLALRRAIFLMEQLGAGRLTGAVIDRYPAPRSERSIALRRERLALVLGLAVPDAEVERILSSLGLTVAPVEGGWTVVVPTFRVDLSREVDLMEEVGRHFGFDKLEARFPVVTQPAPPPDPRVERDRLVRRVLTAAGSSEAVTFGFIEAKAARAFEAVGDAGAAWVRIANPLSAKFDVLRASLLPGLVDAVAYNRRHGLRDIALFEIGARFDIADAETRAVGIAWTGSAAPEHWASGQRDVDFFDIKGVVEDLCAALDVDPRFVPATRPFLVDGQSASIVVDETEIGLVGLLAPDTAESRDARRNDKIYVAELNLDRIWTLARAPDERVRALPRHLPVVRDVSIIVAETLPAEIIRGTIQAAGRVSDAPLVDVAFFDRYKGKGVDAGAVSVSVRLTFQSADRTLTDAEVQESVDRIVAALRREHGAVQR